MVLTYTIELQLSDDVLGPSHSRLRELTEPDEVSAEIMRQAFARVGKRLAGRTIDYMTIFAHLDSVPSELPDDVTVGDEESYPGEACPTCGIAQLNKAAA